MTDVKKLKPDDSSFNLLMQTLLGDLTKDLEEAERNVKRYEDLLIGENGETNEMSVAMYGSLLNDALKIKASVRDKIIKMLGNLKDRVRTKEQMASSAGSDEDYSEEELNRLADRILEKEKGDE